MRIFLFFLIVLLAFSCYKEEEKLLKISGKLEKSTQFDEQDKTTVTRIYHYNGFGEIAKTSVIGWDGKDAGDIKYYYNERQQLVEEVSKVWDNFYTKKYFYDDKDRLIKTTGDGTIEYEYDEFNRLIGIYRYKVLFSGERSYISGIKYSYDSTGSNKIMFEYTFRIHAGNFDDADLYEKLEYIYNDEGQLVQKKLVDGKQFLYRGTKEFFEYDSQGRLYKKLEYGLNLYMSNLAGLLYTWTYYYYE